MSKRALIGLILFLILLGLFFYTSPYFVSIFNHPGLPKITQLNLASSTLGLFFSNNVVNKIISLPQIKEVQQTLVKTQKQIILPPPSRPAVVKVVSSKSLTELINSSVIQIYCGYLNADKTAFSGIDRGSGVIINSQGEVLTNRHIVYDDSLNEAKTDCFIMRSPFPNAASEKPKIYYFASVENLPQTEKFSKNFSDTKYYNDIALLKIGARTNSDNSKINLMLGMDYATDADYSVLENNGVFNFLPFDWNYMPQSGDQLISAGYGTDASQMANQITSSEGAVSGAISTVDQNRLDMLVVTSNATPGFSGGALMNPQSKGLVGLVSWVSSGEEAGKYTVAIFRDFLSLLAREEFNIDLKVLTNE